MQTLVKQNMLWYHCIGSYRLWSNRYLRTNVISIAQTQVTIMKKAALETEIQVKKENNTLAVKKEPKTTEAHVKKENYTSGQNQDRKGQMK